MSEHIRLVAYKNIKRNAIFIQAQNSGLSVIYF